MPRKTRREELKDNFIKALEEYITYERQDAVREYDTKLRQTLNDMTRPATRARKATDAPPSNSAG